MCDNLINTNFQETINYKWLIFLDYKLKIIFVLYYHYTTFYQNKRLNL